MPQKRHGVDQIIPKLRQADVELGKGKKVPEICKTIDISEQTYYRWRQKYEGAKPRCVYLAQPSGLGLVGSGEKLFNRTQLVDSVFGQAGV
ncbi:MAG: helix-turn-helix domain-containing protein [Pirellulaceae bacterium]